MEPSPQAHKNSPPLYFLSILDKYLIKKFVGPFFLTFFLSLFIILMQFLWKYVDDLVGKGLEWYLILELLFYASATFVAMALPLAVLLSSLMTFGNLGERYEIVAMKSAGIPVMRLMRPLAIISIVISLFSFWFAENVLPMANVKLRTLLYEIREQKPTLSIEEGVFYDGLGDYTIRIGKKFRDNERIEDILIYDHSQNIGNVTATYAQRGTMTMTPDKMSFIFWLYDGYYWDESQSQGNYQSSYPYFFAKFDEQYMKFDLSSFQMQKADESFFKSSNKSMTMKQLDAQLDTMKKELQIVRRNLTRHYFDQTYFYKLWIAQREMGEEMEVVAYSLDSLTSQERSKIYANAEAKVDNYLLQLPTVFEILEMSKTMYNQYAIEWHRKIVLALACFLFFFIGAPLGTIIRKGGIGIPLVITVAFFAFYFVISIIGEKMAKTSDIAVWLGMWLSTFIIIPICVFLTYKATMDSVVMSPDTYANFWKKITKFFNKNENSTVLS